MGNKFIPPLKDVGFLCFPYPSLDKIESKSLPEHPSYEDYLEALSFEKDMAKLKTEINKNVEEVLK